MRVAGQKKKASPERKLRPGSAWCRWWDLNPHVIADNGFWVRRVCHSTTPANYSNIIHDLLENCKREWTLFLNFMKSSSLILDLLCCFKVTSKKINPKKVKVASWNATFAFFGGIGEGGFYKEAFPNENDRLSPKVFWIVGQSTRRWMIQMKGNSTELTWFENKFFLLHKQP